MWLAVDHGGAPVGGPVPRATGPADGAGGPAPGRVRRGASPRSVRWVRRPGRRGGRMGDRGHRRPGHRHARGHADHPFGAPRPRRSWASRIGELALGDDQTWGETRFVGRTSDGRPASVVVIGRDGADARLLSKVWRSTLYRDAGPSIAITRSAQLEHRAYMHLMAAKAGVPVSEVVIAALRWAGGHRAARAARPRRPPLRRRSAPTRSPTTCSTARGRASTGCTRPGWPTGTWRRRTSWSDRTGRSPCSTSPAGRPAGHPSASCATRSTCSCPPPALVGDDRALAAAMRAVGADGMAELLPDAHDRRALDRGTPRDRGSAQAAEGAARRRCRAQRRARCRSSPSCGASR